MLSALERCLIYRGFAEAFTSPSGGIGIFDESLIPLPSGDATTEFLNAFDPAVAKSACSLYASAHSSRDQTALYEELVRWYDHFGLQRKAKAELPDHISVLLEFMHFLAYREHLCADNGERKKPLTTAQSEFLEKHVLPLVTTIRANSSTAARRYKAIARQAHIFIEDQIADLERMKTKQNTAKGADCER